MAAKPASATKRKAKQGQRRARQANRSWVGAALARGGLAARGVVYLVLGGLTVDIVVNARSKVKASGQGAFDVIARPPAGFLAVAILAVGLAAYAAWRGLQALAGDAHERGGEEVAKRVGWGAASVAYLGLSVSAWEVVLGRNSNGDEPSSLSQSLLGVNGGSVLLGLLGTAVVVGGMWLILWAVLQRFDRYLTIRNLSSGLQAGVRVVETFGNVIRGVAFAGVGASLVVAAVANNPHDAKGLNGAVRTFAAPAYGKLLLILTAAGFVAFGAASLFEARYRDVDKNAEPRK